MKRRDFLQRALALTAGGLIVPPFLRGKLGSESLLARAVDRGFEHPPLVGRILVQVNLSGGNDGLSSFVPVTDATYYAVRPTIAIPPEETVPITDDTGLHAGLAPLADFYSAGQMALLHGVGYPQMNLSHFRSTDIWFSASASDQYLDTGWIARFIEAMFPSFPAILPESPYGLQQTLTHRIPLTGERGVTGVIVDDPATFHYLVNTNYTGDWNDPLPDTRGGEELDYVRAIDRESFAYAEAIQTASESGQNTVAYPETNLGRQLEIVARLISGGLDTPFFLTSEFGFDTHAAQRSTHDALMYSVGQSLMAFLNDLANQALDDRVLVVTSSEFARRVEENGSEGTDHGTAAPHIALGAQVIGGVYGIQPSLTELDENGNLLVQQDFRAMYATILRDFFGANPNTVQSVLMGEFPSLGFLEASSAVGDDEQLPPADRILALHPNPLVARASSVPARLRFALAQPARVRLDLIDAQGRVVTRLLEEQRGAGTQELMVPASRLAAGTYFLRLRTPLQEAHARLVVIP